MTFALPKYDPKMNENMSSLSVVISYTVAKPMERRFQKIKKNLTHLTHFLPHSVIALGPKMSKMDLH